MGRSLCYFTGQNLRESLTNKEFIPVASHQTSGAAARRYATALVETALESKNLDAVLTDFADLEAMLGVSPDLQRAVTSPLFDRNEQVAAMNALADKAKFQKETKHFLMLLAQNRRLSMISAVIAAVRDAAADLRGEVNATVQSASKLSGAQEKALVDALSKTTGKSVNIKVEVREDLIGGMVVTVGSKMIDDSVKRKLERLERALTGGANQNTQIDKAS